MPIKLININFINALALIVASCSFAFFFYTIITGKKDEQIATAIINGYFLLLGFYFGSSKSSVNKDRTIKDMQDTINTASTQPTVKVDTINTGDIKTTE